MKALLVAVAGQAVGAAIGLSVLAYLGVINFGPAPEPERVYVTKEPTPEGMRQMQTLMYSCVGRKLDEDRERDRVPARDSHFEYFLDLWSQCFHEEANRLAK